MGRLAASLDSLYAAGLPRDTVLVRRQGVFRASRAAYYSMRDQFRISSYDRFFEGRVNNARLLSYRRYHRGLESFEELYVLKNLRLDLVVAVCKSCEGATDPWFCLRDSIEAAGQGAAASSAIAPRGDPGSHFAP